MSCHGQIATFVSKRRDGRGAARIPAANFPPRPCQSQQCLDSGWGCRELRGGTPGGKRRVWGSHGRATGRVQGRDHWVSWHQISGKRSLKVETAVMVWIMVDPSWSIGHMGVRQDMIRCLLHLAEVWPSSCIWQAQLDSSGKRKVDRPWRKWYWKDDSIWSHHRWKRAGIHTESSFVWTAERQWWEHLGHQEAAGSDLQWTSHGISDLLRSPFWPESHRLGGCMLGPIRQHRFVCGAHCDPDSKCPTVGWHVGSRPELTLPLRGLSICSFFLTTLFDIIGIYTYLYCIYWYVLIRIVFGPIWIYLDLFGSIWIYLAIDIGSMTIVLWHW